MKRVKRIKRGMKRLNINCLFMANSYREELELLKEVSEVYWKNLKWELRTHFKEEDIKKFYSSLRSEADSTAPYRDGEYSLKSREIIEFCKKEPKLDYLSKRYFRKLGEYSFREKSHILYTPFTLYVPPFKQEDIGDELIKIKEWQFEEMTEFIPLYDSHQELNNEKREKLEGIIPSLRGKLKRLQEVYEIQLDFSDGRVRDLNLLKRN